MVGQIVKMKIFAISAMFVLFAWAASAATRSFEAVLAYSNIQTHGGEFLDADDLIRRSNVGGDFSEGNSYYIGFNYFIKGNDLKLSGGYELSTFEDDAGAEVDIDALRMRLQVLF